MDHCQREMAARTRPREFAGSVSAFGNSRFFLNRYLFLVTQSPKKNVLHPGFVFLAELALQSDDYIETCDIHLEKQSCRCYVLPVLHKTISTLPRPFDVRDATTQSRNIKHTKYHHLDMIPSTTKWESMCSRSLTQSACASRS